MALPTKFIARYASAVLALEALIELGVGLTMLFAPQAFYPEAPQRMLELARDFGNGAMMPGLIGVFALIYRGREASVMGFCLLACYHTGVAILQARTPWATSMPWAGTAFHGWLALSFLALLIWTLRGGSRE